MATSNEQLKNIYQDLKAKFDNHPFIKVSPFEGDPPEKYEIQYSIRGLVQDSDGKVVESSTHSVFINIPFGYPHFPPSCTPQSPTFHPDFDQAAICIGEFWNKDRSLSELVIYIGQMIAGEIYSIENAFNDSAAEWYQKIASELPFEKKDFSYSSSPEEPEIRFDEEDLLLEGMDTLDDSDITGHPDYFGSDQPTLEDDEISFPSTAKSSGKSSVNRVYLLIRQKRFYELSGFLNELGEEDNFDDRAEIEQKISDLLEKAKTLQREADEFEHQGNPKMALELFEKVASIVPDFPNIDENIERTKNSVELAGDWETEGDGVEEAEAKQDKQGAKKRGITFFEDSTKKSIRLLPILGAVLVVILAIVFITPLFTAKSHLESAGIQYEQCRKFIEQGNFNQADIQCSEALEHLKMISLYKTGARDEMERQIALTLSSDKMQQGLAGRVFFQGKYIKKTDRDRVLEFNNLKTAGDSFYEKSQWKKAIGQYNAALKTAQPISESFIDVILQEIRNKIKVSEVNLSIDRGFSLLSRGELEKSKEMFSSALGEAEKLPEELGGDLISRTESKIQEIQYLQHLDLGKKYFSANDWESAIKQYEKALQLRDTSIAPLGNDEDETASLYANMAEAELFALINSAKDAFSQSLLDDAIKKYQEAISLLKAKKGLLERINPDEIEQQLERIILRTRIVQFKQIADKELNEQKFDDAIATYNNVISVINKNGFENDQEFKAIIEGTKETITETRKKAVVASRIDYLEKNFKKIFEENYSAAVPEYLSEPKATFLRYIDNGKELYEIQCLEENRGRKLRLVMLYSYDPSRKKWEFYSENS